METFAQKFFKIYDRKILSGEISFSRSGISRNDFTGLCTDPDFVMERDALLIVCEKMELTEEETAELLKFCT
ncbi:MAG: hypothetical protein Q4A40_03670 [Bacillota bacterium]|nr:hypothetical protein [Bacillota bacterium]